MASRSAKDRKVTYEFPQFQPHDRLWELILHIAQFSEGDPTFGKVKLAKILYYTDFTSYRDYGQPVTGSAYRKMQRGPVPTHFLDILDEMAAGREIYIRKEKAFPTAVYEYERVMAVREANLVNFTGRDIMLVNELISRFWNKSAAEISDESHGIAWKLVGDNEPIPYEASLLSDEPLTEAETEWAIKVAQEYDLK
jgi:hypothetical protein